METVDDETGQANNCREISRKIRKNMVGDFDAEHKKRFMQ
jgi:hypothetical protein